MNYEGFKEHILAMTGIDLSLYKENQMKRRINALIRKNQYSGYSDYVVALKKDRDLLEEFTTYLTINVTEFFRNPSQWDVLENYIFPRLIYKKGIINIWSAACSTGDEPYSLAMTLSKVAPLSQIKILATDLDKEVLKKARRGYYTKKNLLNLPTHLQERFMVPYEEGYMVKDEIKRCIEFREHNLLSDPYPKNMDLIVCRNVLIYFTEEAKETIYSNFNRSLRDNGILFVGSTEQIIRCQQFGFQSDRIFFYEKINSVDMTRR